MAQVRILRMALLNAHRETGAILINAKRFGVDFSALIKKHKLSSRHANVCMDLYNNWEQVIAAEQWGHDQGWLAPVTPIAAMRLVPRWKSACKFH